MDNNLIMQLEIKKLNSEKINKKIEIVLDKRDEINQEYDELVKKQGIFKKRRVVFIISVNTVMFLIGAFLLLKLVSIFKFLELILYLYYAVGGLFAVFVQAYGFSRYYDVVSDEECLCRDLFKSEEYKYLIEQIQDKEREMKYLDMEYESLATERDNLEVEIHFQRIEISTNDDRVEEDMIESAKYTKSGILSDGEKHGDSIDSGSKNDRFVRRNMRDEMKNNRKRENFD